MIKISRLWLAVISLTFGTFMGVLGVLRYENFHSLYWAISASAYYFACLLITTLAFKSNRLHTWAAWLNVSAALYIPIVIHTNHIGAVNGDNDTWYVTALALIFGSMAVREQLRLAIAGSVILVLQVLVLGGLDFVSRSGLAGAIMLVISAIAVSRGLDKSAKTIEEFQEQNSREKREMVVVERARKEHRARLNLAIEKVMPTLRQISSETKLSSAQREAAGLLAQQLEDEISGGRLATETVKSSAAAARKRGVEVTLIDDTKADFDADSLQSSTRQYSDILEVAVAAIDKVNVGRIKLLAPKDENYLLRLTVTRPGVVTPDLDLKLGERQLE